MKKEIGMGTVVVIVVLIGMVMITTPTLTMGYIVTKVTPHRGALGALSTMLMLRFGMVIYHDNATGENREYVLPDSPMGQWVEKVAQTYETWATTQLPVEWGDKVVHAVETIKRDMYSATEYVPPGFNFTQIPPEILQQHPIPVPPSLPIPSFGIGGNETQPQLTQPELKR